MTRFSEFQRSLGIAPNVLATRLQGFVEAGLMQSDEPYGSPQPRYRLTEKGQSLAPVIVALTAWGDRWAAPDGPPVIFAHADCGADVRLAISCDRCGRELRPPEVQSRPGRGAAAEPD